MSLSNQDQQNLMVRKSLADSRSDSGSPSLSDLKNSSQCLNIVVLRCMIMFVTSVIFGCVRSCFY